MKASRLIELLASHIGDTETGGGDFEVHLWSRNPEHPVSPPANMALDSKPTARCWLYPGIAQIIIGTE
jgi:hypothetical protein